MRRRVDEGGVAVVVGVLHQLYLVVKVVMLAAVCVDWSLELSTPRGIGNDFSSKHSNWLWHRFAGYCVTRFLTSRIIGPICTMQWYDWLAWTIEPTNILLNTGFIGHKQLLFNGTNQAHILTWQDYRSKLCSCQTFASCPSQPLLSTTLTMVVSFRAMLRLKTVLTDFGHADLRHMMGFANCHVWAPLKWGWCNESRPKFNFEQIVGCPGVNKMPKKFKTVLHGVRRILKLSGRVNQARLKLSAGFSNTVCWTS